MHTHIIEIRKNLTAMEKAYNQLRANHMEACLDLHRLHCLAYQAAEKKNEAITAELENKVIRRCLQISTPGASFKQLRLLDKLLSTRQKCNDLSSLFDEVSPGPGYTYCQATLWIAQHGNKYYLTTPGGETDEYASLFEAELDLMEWAHEYSDCLGD